ncbi:Gag polyprotein [Plecturocebus cupreus]
MLRSEAAALLGYFIWSKMGQLESKEYKLFVHLLQSMIKSQGHDVKLKMIEEFLHIVREICPWVPEGGVLDEPTCNIIGEKIEQFCFYNKDLPQSNVLLSVWSKLRKCICASMLSQPSMLPYSSTASLPQPAQNLLQTALDFKPPESIPVPPDQDEFAECSSYSHHSEYAPSAFNVPLTEVIVSQPENTTPTPQWTPGPITLTLPPDFLHQFQDLLSLCSQAITNRNPHCFPIVQESAPTSGALTLRATNTAPITPLTHALMSLQRGFSEYDNIFPALFPVVEVVDNQGNHVQNYNSIPPKTLKELKEVVAQYGPTAPYIISLLENLTTSALPPCDWG